MPRGGEAAAHAFHGGLLRLPELTRPEPLRVRRGVWFACGPVELHLGVEDGFRPARKAYPVLAVEGLDDRRSHLAFAGMPVIDDAALPGCRRFHTAAPFGSRRELIERRDGAPNAGAG